MSRKSLKSRAASSKTPTGFGASSFGAFSTNSRGTDLSYLAEPPDLSSVSDANVVVSLKNLQKKDATTKAKALEELVTHVQAHPYEQDGGTEEPILEAWVRILRKIHMLLSLVSNMYYRSSYILASQSTIPAVFANSPISYSTN